MSVGATMMRAADRIFDRIAPKAVAKADRYECSYEFRCVGINCSGPGSVHNTTRQRRMVCAGHDGPSYGRWERVGCCSW